MSRQTDLTFITNEEGQSLLERFKVLIRDTELFDVLVGYFYSSGFHALYRSLEKTKQIRILIGIGSDKKTAAWIQSAGEQRELPFSSHAEVKERFSRKLVEEMDDSQDTKEVYEGVMKFMEWMRSGKLQIRAYPDRKIHAKLYIMSFVEGDRDRGRVITGSSNFTRAGLTENLEFNAELKSPSDYKFALQKFHELWEAGADVQDAYLKTIQEKTWLNDSVTPRQLYLKFLYEHFKEDLESSDEFFSQYAPADFKRLEYQNQAVQSAKRILGEYGGVFLSDVVGLGKTYMSAMLAGRLKGRSLVLAPPLLLDESNPGSWKNVFSDFRVHADFESLGKLDKVISRGTDKYENIFIDEAHRFRRETNVTYEKLARICRGENKKVILVTATPFNNAPSDILSQIKLFQRGGKSAIPNVSDLESFFRRLEQKLKNLDKKENYAEYMKVSRENAKKIRESVLKYVMVRRTRTEIEKYFADDLSKQNVKFPEVKDPEPVYYKFNKTENKIFHETARLISQKLKYARYTPLTYYKKQDQLKLDIQSQKNLGGFMKILLVKRLESSFFAFRNSIHRFIRSYERFLGELENGFVYVSKDYSNKIFELLSNDDEEAVQKLIEEDKAKKYAAEDFTENLERDLKNDLETLREIKSLWRGIERDPKLLTFKEILSSSAPGAPSSKSALEKSAAALVNHNSNMQTVSSDKSNNIFSSSSPGGEAPEPSVLSASKKLIVFTESKETAEYLGEELSKKFPGEVLVFTGSSGARERERIIDNFDPDAFRPKDDCRILVATDVLSEGVNLHRSNVIVNYDIPWNPTRLRQRAGRINRVGTGFSEIHTFNFFPAEQFNDIIRLEETAKAKIAAFINLLGADARLLTEEEAPESHELFGRLVSKKTVVGEDEGEESELKYLKIIQKIRDKNPDLFKKIKRLPKKARTAKILSSALTQSGQAGLSSGVESQADKLALPSGNGGFSNKIDNQAGKQNHAFQSAGGSLNRVEKASKQGENQLLTYFRKGKLHKFCLAGAGERGAKELDFMDSAKLLEAEENTPREALPPDFYSKLQKNKEKFLELSSGEEDPDFAPFPSGRSGGGADSASKLLKYLKIVQKDMRQFTEGQEACFQKIMRRLGEGALPKHTVKTALKALEKETKAYGGLPPPLKALSVLQANIPAELLKPSGSEKAGKPPAPREVILSEYLIGNYTDRG